MKTSWQLFYHRALDVGIVFKGLNRLLEFAAALMMLLKSRATLVGVPRGLAQQVLIEDPDNFLATHALHLTHRLPIGSWNFAAAYPVAIAVLTAFIGYQGCRWFHQPSFFLGYLSLLDLLIVLLVAIEWRGRREPD